MSISEGLDPYVFLPKNGKDAVFDRRNEWRGVFSRQSWDFAFADKIIEILFPICTLTWRVNTYISRRRKDLKRKRYKYITQY